MGEKKEERRTDLARFFPHFSVLSREGLEMERIQPRKGDTHEVETADLSGHGKKSIA